MSKNIGCILAFVLFFSMQGSASHPDEISITSARGSFIPCAIIRCEIHVPISIKFENHPGNRKIFFDWSDGASERQLNNLTAREFEEGVTVKNGYTTVSDFLFMPRTGLILAPGVYELRAVLTRIVNGEEKKFPSVLKITIGSEFKSDTGMDIEGE